MTSVEQQFTEFAALAAPRLRRTAFLLCGDWHTATGTDTRSPTWMRDHCAGC